jgi:hypothetical protein
MTAVLCRCGRAHGILEFKVLRLWMNYAQKPAPKALVSPLRTLKSGKMVAGCCSEPLCDMLGNPVLSRTVSMIRYTNLIDDTDGLLP